MLSSCQLTTTPLSLTARLWTVTGGPHKYSAHVYMHTSCCYFRDWVCVTVETWLPWLLSHVLKCSLVAFCGALTSSLCGRLYTCSKELYLHLKVLPPLTLEKAWNANLMFEWVCYPSSSPSHCLSFFTYQLQQAYLHRHINENKLIEAIV